MAIEPKVFSEDDETKSSPEEDVDQPKSKPKFNSRMLQMIGIFVLLVILVAVLVSTMNKEKTVTEVDPETGETVEVSVDPDGLSRPWLKDNANAGASNETTSDVEATVPTGEKNALDVSDSKELIKAFSGDKVDEHYSVSGVRTEIDFVSYTLKRHSTSEGIELYWLDAKYKEIPVIIMVPYSIAQGLDPVGITVVDVEITSVYDDNYNTGEIITGFTVRPDYKEQIQGGVGY